MSERPLIALSMGNSDDLVDLGFGPEHLDDVAIRLTRFLLRRGYNISYGGVFRSRSFTDTIIDVVRAETAKIQDEKIAKLSESGGEQGTEPPRDAVPNEAQPDNHDSAAPEKEPVDSAPFKQARLINFQPWPHYDGITPEVVAQTLGLVRYVKVHPVELKGCDHHSPASAFMDPPDASVQRGAALGALSTTRMRKAMAEKATAIDGQPVPAPTARIVVGGKITGWSGVLPGIAEEVLWSGLGDNENVFILGGFGGAARVLAEYLYCPPKKDGKVGDAVKREDQSELANEPEFPEALSLDYQRAKTKKLPLVTEGLKERQDKVYSPAEAFENLKIFLKEVKRGKRKLNSLSADENRILATSENLITLMGLIGGALSTSDADDGSQADS